MSGRAVGLVFKYGPDELELAMLCAVVADWMDADGRGAHVGLRTLAGRARLSLYRARIVLERALAEGWLTVEKAGDASGAAVYACGPTLLDRAEAREKPRAPRGPVPAIRARAREIRAGVATQTVNGVKRPARAAPRGAGAAGVGDAPPHVPSHPPSCQCQGNGWVAHNGGDEVIRCPGEPSTAELDGGHR